MKIGSAGVVASSWGIGLPVNLPRGERGVVARTGSLYLPGFLARTVRPGGFTWARGLVSSSERFRLSVGRGGDGGLSRVAARSGRCCGWLVVPRTASRGPLAASWRSRGEPAAVVPWDPAAMLVAGCWRPAPGDPQAWARGALLAVVRSPATMLRACPVARVRWVVRYSFQAGSSMHGGVYVALFRVALVATPSHWRRDCLNCLYLGDFLYAGVMSSLRA